MQVFAAGGEADVSFGALRLLDPKLRPRDRLELVAPLEIDLGPYRRRWHDEIAKNAPVEGRGE
jgi:hypothetical protein